MDDAPPSPAPAPPTDSFWLPRKPWPSWLQMYPTKPGQEHPADLPERLCAYLVDVVGFSLLTVVPALLSLLVGGLAPLIVVVTTVGLLLCYSPLSTARWGGSPGKRLLRLRVARAKDGAPIPYRVALGRHLAHLGLNSLSHLWYLWDQPLQQCLHDKMAGTVVVRVEPENARVPGGM